MQIQTTDIFFDTINSISNFNIYEMVWNQYVKFCLPKIERCIDILKADRTNLQQMSSGAAQDQLKELKSIVVLLPKYKQEMSEIIKTNNEAFFKKSLEFINEIETTVEILEEISEPNAAWKMFCQSAINNDWNHPDNDHWDTENY
jgi:hypothetical protein